MAEDKIRPVGSGLLLHYLSGGPHVEKIDWFRETPKKVQSANDGLYYWKDDIKAFDEHVYNRLRLLEIEREQCARRLQEIPNEIEDMFNGLPKNFIGEDKNEQDGVQSGNGQGNDEADEGVVPSE